MPTHDYPYKNLVFEGGGVKGVAYGGVFEVLEQKQITPQIEPTLTSGEDRALKKYWSPQNRPIGNPLTVTVL